MAVASVEDVVPLIRHLGLQNNRAKTMVAMARMWVAQEPCKGRRYRTLNYPRKGAGKGIGREEVIGDEDDMDTEEEPNVEDAVVTDVLGHDAIVEEAATSDMAHHGPPNRDSSAHVSKIGNVIDLEDYDETTSNSSDSSDVPIRSNLTNISTLSPSFMPESMTPSQAEPCKRAREPKPNAKLSASSKRHSSGAWEIAHLPGVGAYAIDSWRIFCRDVLRGVATAWDGEDAEASAMVHSASCHHKSNQRDARGHDVNSDLDLDAQDEETRTGHASPREHRELMAVGETRSQFEPEWMRVVPLDKELRAYLRWKWLKNGWVWDPLTGKRTRVEEMEVDQVIGGGEGGNGNREQGRRSSGRDGRCYNGSYGSGKWRKCDGG